MLWQAYPQHDQAHQAKLQAFLGLYLAGWPAPLAGRVHRAWAAFNGGAVGLAGVPEDRADVDAAPWSALADSAAWAEGGDWAAAHDRWRAGLLARADLCDQLLAFAADKRASPRGPNPG